MTKMKWTLRVLLLSTVATSALPSIATAESIFSGQDNGVGSSINDGAKRSLAELPNSLTSFGKFKADTPVFSVESFEDYGAFQSITNVVSGTNIVQIEGGIVGRPTNGLGHINGAFAISGEQFLFVNSNVTFRFSTPQSVFGLFVTDIESGPLEMSLIETNGIATSYVVPSRVRSSKSGGCLFFAIAGHDVPFVMVRIRSQYGESFGLDDILTANPPPPAGPATISIERYAGLTISGTKNASYRIETSRTPEFITWQTQNVISLPQPQFLYFDEQPLRGSVERYYRVVPDR